MIIEPNEVYTVSIVTGAGAELDMYYRFHTLAPPDGGGRDDGGGEARRILRARLADDLTTDLLVWRSHCKAMARAPCTLHEFGSP